MIHLNTQNTQDPIVSHRNTWPQETHRTHEILSISCTFYIMYREITHIALSTHNTLKYTEHTRSHVFRVLMYRSINTHRHRDTWYTGNTQNT